MTTPVVTLKGSMLPRLFTPPLAQGRPGPCGCGCALTRETSLGYSLVDFVESLGLALLPWQRWLAIHAFELHPHARRFRYRTLLILVARQNGKTTWVELKNLWKMFVLQVPLVIGTAQNLDLAEESWSKALDIVESVDFLAAEVARIDKTNGKKGLTLVNGARWLIKPSTRGGGRGLSGDDINLDELREHRNFTAWAAVSKTTMARRDAQVFAFSNAGDDGSLVLNALQEQARTTAAEMTKILVTRPSDAYGDVARAGLDDSMGLFEWSVPDDVKCTCMRTGGRPHKPDCQLQDRELWAMANPSLGYAGFTEQALISALATDPEAIFRTECLCQRVPDMGTATIDPVVWESLHDPESRPDPKRMTIAIDVSPSGDYGSICTYSAGDDGIGHVELTDHREGTRWIAERVATLKERYNPVAIVFDPSSSAGTVALELARLLIIEQKTREVDDYEGEWDYARNQVGKKEVWDRGGLYLPGSREVAAACGQFVEAVREGSFRHIEQTPLTVAVSTAKPRPRGDAWVWGRRLADTDISPLVAATLARYAYAKLSPLLPDDGDYDVLQSFL